MRRRFTLTLTVALLSACGRDLLELRDGGSSGSGGGDGGAGAAQASPFTSGDYCTREAAWRARCGIDPNIAECQQDANCYANTIRRDAQAGLADCLVDRPCNSDGRCYAKAAAAYTKEAAFTRFRDVCNQKLCGYTSHDMRDQCSDEFALRTDEFIAGLQTCLNSSCAGMTACRNEKAKAWGCW